MKFVLGKKIEMTQVFKEDGQVIPVTAVLVQPNVVTQVKSKDKDGYVAVQIGTTAVKKLKKPQAGHLKGLDQVRNLKEFKVEADQAEKLKRGDVITASIFTEGDKIKVTGISKGRGFQGVVKRHGFHGAPATHGHKDQERMPGSIGATDAARVFKGMRMPGQMGNVQRTVTGLEIVSVDAEKNIVYVKGAVPGARNGLLLISGPGEMELGAQKVEEVKVEEPKTEEKPVEEVKEEAPKEEKVEETQQEPKTEESK